MVEAAANGSEWMIVGQRPGYKEVLAESPATRYYWLIWDSLFLQDDLLYRHHVSKDGVSEHTQLLLPRTLKQNVMYQSLGVKKSRVCIIWKLCREYSR